MVWLCGLHSEDVCTIADAIPNRLFYQVSHSSQVTQSLKRVLLFQCPLMGDFFTYVVDAELYLGLIWLVSYLWINQHIWYPKVFVKSTLATKCPTSQLQSPRLATSEQIFGTPWYDGLFIDQVDLDNVGFSKLIPSPRAS